MQAVNKEYKTAEKVQKLIVEFVEGGDTLTLDDISVEGTTTECGGWRVATKWDPAKVSHLHMHNYSLCGVC